MPPHRRPGHQPLPRGGATGDPFPLPDGAQACPFAGIELRGLLRGAAFLQVVLHGLPVLRRGPRARRVRCLPSCRSAEEGLLQAVLDAGQLGGQGPGHRPGAVPARGPPPAAQLRRHAALGRTSARAAGRQARPAGGTAPAGATPRPARSPAGSSSSSWTPGGTTHGSTGAAMPTWRVRGWQGGGLQPRPSARPEAGPAGSPADRSRAGHPAVRPCRRR